MGETHPGDTVFDEAGNPCLVIAESDIFINHDCYEIEFDSGEKVIADGDHRWATLTDKDRNKILRSNPEWMARRRKNRPSRGMGIRPDVAIGNSQFAAATPLPIPPKPSIKTTKEIFDTVKIRNNTRTNHSVECANALNLPELELLVEPYLLGVWLGDGTHYSGGITCDHKDRETIDRIIDFGYKVTNNGNIRWGIWDLQWKLIKIGVLSNKHIPGYYLNSSYSQRLELLRGLMDSDGDCSEDGGAEFSNTNYRIASGVLELAQGLGIKSTISEGRATLYGKDCGPKWRVKMTTSVRVFHLHRKAIRQNEKVRDTQKRHYIISCKKINSVPVKCIAVDSLSHLYLCSGSLIPTHNTDLLLGIAATQQLSSIIFRRQYTNLKGIVKRSKELFTKYAKYNANEHIWRGLPCGREIEFGAAQYEESVEKQRGVPRDFHGFDESTQFSKSQIMFLIGWNRSTIPGQRCRVVMCFNPPTNASERWIIEFFGPWLDRKHPNPALPGELRWFARIDGKDVERPNGETFTHIRDDKREEQITPLSRTFFPSKLSDNPILAATNYEATVQSMPEPLRSQLLYGDFEAGLEDDAWQLIPTDWVIRSMQRWRETEEHRIKCEASYFEQYGAMWYIGVDVAHGGADQTIFACRRGLFVQPLIEYGGKETPTGEKAAQFLKMAWEDNAIANIDAIGAGWDCHSRTVDLDIPCQAIVSSCKSTYTDRSGKLKMVNLRAEAYWRVRDALDPNSGHPTLMLPDDATLLADLTAPRFKIRPGGVIIEPKDEIKKRIGRSPDKGDAIAYSVLPDLRDRPAEARTTPNPAADERWGTV